LISLNEIFLATQEIEFRAVIDKKNEDKLLFTPEEIEEMVFELTENIIRVEFE